MPVGARARGPEAICLATACPAAASKEFNEGAFPRRIDVTYDGFTGGAQVGYNWHWNSLIVGVETDINYAAWSGTTTAPRIIPGPGATSFTLSQKIDAFGTARGRVGFTPTDRTLVYATGGFAFGHTKTDYFFPSGNQPTFTGTDTSWKTGWTVGGGVEQALRANWSAKIEALYYELANSLVVARNTSEFFGTSNTEYRGYLIRAGANYKFN